MKKIALSLIGIFTIFFFIACGSTPEAEPEPEPEVQEQITEEPPVEEVPAEIPEDFSQANNDLLSKTTESRQKAIDAGAESLFSDGFKTAEGIFESLKNDVAGNPNKDYSVEIKDLTDRYDSLALACEAKSYKDKVDSMEFSTLDKAIYETGELALADYSDKSATSSGADLIVSAQSANDAYKTLVNKGYVALAGRERSDALAAKKNADSVKAGVSQKETYTKASDMFKKADSAYVTNSIESAYEGYKSAKEIFTELYETISVRRAEALAAIERAKQKVSDSENYAVEADTIAPPSAETEGIESEDTVLLEEDNLANPDEAVIDVEEGITAEIAEKTAAAAIAADEFTNAAADSAADAVNSAVEEAENAVLQEAK